MVDFYDHPQTGKLHLQGVAGGGGGGGTSMYDGVATEADIKAYPAEHDRYHARKREASEASAKAVAQVKVEADALAALKTESEDVAQKVAGIETNQT